MWTWAPAAWVAIVVGSCAMVLMFPRQSRQAAWLSRRALMWLGQHAVAVSAGTVAVWGLAVLLGAGGFPRPHIHDEFSYLLAADTFAHGRLANPPHPLWPSLETFHVNHQPVYVSMYLPGWGLVLAWGQMMLGHPWMAVWASALGMVLAVYWAALGWLPRMWAAGASAAASGIVMGGYWLSSYWGGTLPATGGALVVGSWPRMIAGERWGQAAFGAGTVILLYTRPWEGGVLTAVVTLGLFGRRVKRWGWAFVLVGLGGGWLGYYNWRTTGNPLEPAYLRNMATYHHRRLFLFGKDREPAPVYRHEAMRQLYSESYRLDPFSAEVVTQRTIPNFTFFGGHLLVFVMVGAGWLLWRDRRVRLVTWATGAVVGVVLLSVWMRPHYLAPATAGLMIVSMQALRWAGTFRWRGIRVGRLMAFAGLGCWLVLRAGVGVMRLEEDASPEPWARRRDEIARKLERNGGRHLIFVKYDTTRHNPNEEWVFNGADLGAGARIIWARAMNEAADGELREYYPNRMVWLVEVGGDGEPRLQRLGR